MFLSHVKKLGVLSDAEASLRCCEAFDVKPFAQQALLDIKPPPCHVFGDQLGMLHPHMREALQAVLPTHSQPAVSEEGLALGLQSAEAMFQAADAEQKVFREGRKAHCFRHEDACDVWGAAADDHKPDAISMVVAGLCLSCLRHWLVSMLCWRRNCNNAML